MRSSAWIIALACSGCVGGDKVRPPDAGSDAGSDAGEQLEDAGLPRPLDTIFSVGVLDNSAGVPQSAPLVGLMFEEGTHGPSVVVAKRVASPPTLDGVASDWVGIPESVVPLLTRGGAVGMSKEEWDEECTGLYGRPLPYDFGIPTIAVRAAFDAERIYFLLQWPDATENRERDTWYVDAGTWVRSRANEDRATIGFDIGASTPAFQAIGCSGACHLNELKGDVSDAGRAYRSRMHTNQQGEVLDIWTWRAATTDPMGAADDGYIDETSRKNDGPSDWIIQNQHTLDGGLVVPAFMSEQGVNASPRWLLKPDAGPGAVPFDGDGALPGATLPGWVLQRASPNRDDVQAVGRWAGGYWTVELSRTLTTADPRDAQFPPR